MDPLRFLSVKAENLPEISIPSTTAPPKELKRSIAPMPKVIQLALRSVKSAMAFPASLRAQRELVAHVLKQRPRATAILRIIPESFAVYGPTFLLFARCTEFLFQQAVEHYPCTPEVSKNQTSENHGERWPYVEEPEDEVSTSCGEECADEP